MSALRANAALTLLALLTTSMAVTACADTSTGPSVGSGLHTAADTLRPSFGFRTP